MGWHMASLPTNIRLSNGTHIAFDLNAGRDLSNSMYDNSSIVDVFGLPSETKKKIYSIDEANGCPVNVDHLSMCAHNNRTHTECTKHVYSNGLNVSDCDTTNTFFGCVLISVKALPLRAINGPFIYKGGMPLDERTDFIITKQMIQNKVEQAIHSLDDASRCFFKQSIFIRVQNEKNAINMNENWPFLSNDAMQYLHSNFSKVFGINLPSVDRMESPNVPNHKIWFGHAKSKRFITEGLSFSDDAIFDGLYALNLQLAPIANTDAVPTRPILYKCQIKHALSKL